MRHEESQRPHSRAIVTSLRRLLELARPNLGAFGRVAALGFAIAALYVASAI